jgi:hypothetical protein
MGWALLIATIVVLVVGIVVLARQGNPADLSEQEGTDAQSAVVDRPAGPGAEAMGVADPGSPSTAPDRES